MRTLENFLNESLIEALGWTLLHSLWQGALIAIVLALSFYFLRKHSPRLRYAVALFAMLTFVVATVITFTQYHNSPVKSTFTEISYSTVIPDANHPENFEMLIAPPASPTLAQKLENLFEGNLSWLVLCWAIGSIAFLVKLLGGWVYIQRLKSYKTRPVSGEWEDRLNRLQKRFGLRRSIKILESELTQIPMTVGYLKPVILVPLGAFTGIPPIQMEAILSHELAHIARADYLINLMQLVIESLFFYHPAIWWISSQIRAERENICDDMAVKQSGDALAYSRALASLNEQCYHIPMLATALPGNKKKLLARVQRLISVKQARPSFLEGFAGIAVLITGILLLTSGTPSAMVSDVPEMLYEINTTNPKIQGPVVPIELDIPAIEPVDDTLKVKKQIKATISKNNGQLIHITSEDGEITNFVVDGKPIDSADYKNYLEDIEFFDESKKANKAQMTTPFWPAMPDSVANGAVKIVIPDFDATFFNQMPDSLLPDSHALKLRFEIDKDVFFDLQEEFDKMDKTMDAENFRFFFEHIPHPDSILLHLDDASFSKGIHIDSLRIDLNELDFELDETLEHKLDMLRDKFEDENYRLKLEAQIKEQVEDFHKEMEEDHEIRVEILADIEEDIERAKETLHEEFAEHKIYHAIRKQLIADGKIKKQDRPRLILTHNNFYLEGKRQDRKTAKKYLKIAENISGNRLGKDDVLVLGR